MFASTVVQSEAATYTLSDSTWNVTFNSAVSSGLPSGQVPGVVNLVEQSLYYSLNGGPLSAVTNFSLSLTKSGIQNPTITDTYTSAGNMSVAAAYTLNGTTLSDTIKLKNLSTSSQTISLFQFSDFILGGAAGAQMVNMISNSSTIYGANQTGGGISLQNQVEFIGTGPTTEMQANGNGSLFGPFIGGPPYNLDNVTLNASGNAVFAYEWDVTLTPNTSFQISESSQITVPEPSSMALMVSGMLGLALLYRRRRADSVIAVLVRYNFFFHEFSFKKSCEKCVNSKPTK
jgi:hypothetical protein